MKKLQQFTMKITKYRLKEFNKRTLQTDDYYDWSISHINEQNIHDPFHIQKHRHWHTHTHTPSSLQCNAMHVSSAHYVTVEI